MYIYTHYIYTHIHNGMLFSHKKEWNLSICANMDGPWGHYAKWTKSDRERQSYDFDYMWNLKNKLKKEQTQQNRNRHTDTENKPEVARGEGDGGMSEIGEGE